MALKRAYTELWYAMAGTGFTLVCAIALYLWVPGMRMSMETTDEHLTYTRSVIIQNNSGQIKYTKKDDRETAESLLKDAQILQRRFERGEFNMLTVAQSTLENEVAGMLKNRAALRFESKTNADGAELNIVATNQPSALALNHYLTALKTHWKK